MNKKFGSKRQKLIKDNSSSWVDFEGTKISDSHLGQDFYESELFQNMKKLNEDKFNVNFSFATKKRYTDIENKQDEVKAKTNDRKRKIVRLSEMEANNLYFVLNVKQECDEETLKKAFKKECVKNHPDKGGDPDNLDKVVKAYKILSNPNCRKLYDTFSTDALPLIDQLIAEESKLEEISNFKFEFLDLEAIKVMLNINILN